MAKATASNITLNELIAASSDSVLRAIKEQQGGDALFRPRIWVGIYVDILRPGDFQSGPGGP